MGGRFQNWVGTSYLTEIDARQRFTTFGYLEPPQLMVWKSYFFMGSVRFVRVPPYESWANWTNFCSSWENGDFFGGQKCCTLFHTQNDVKSKKISTCIRIHTRVYANTWWWGQICPPVIDKSLDLEKSREEMTPYFLARSRKSNFHFSFYSRFSRFFRKNSISLLDLWDFQTHSRCLQCKWHYLLAKIVNNEILILMNLWKGKWNESVGTTDGEKLSYNLSSKSPSA